MVDELKRKQFRSQVSPRAAVTNEAAVCARQSKLPNKVQQPSQETVPCRCTNVSQAGGHFDNAFHQRPNQLCSDNAYFRIIFKISDFF
jgi:hypothetical protein